MLFADRCVLPHAGILAQRIDALQAGQGRGLKQRPQCGRQAFGVLDLGQGFKRQRDAGHARPCRRRGGGMQVGQQGARRIRG
ncbi:hypothetical protein, partial [Achromobacter xylosoxidans]|uniref:hypothetical protein n=1 Tax=Alcaligenes xylosoxydans xylosoxydans TaxID=85698 RepID=UPI001E4D0DA1